MEVGKLQLFVKKGSGANESTAHCNLLPPRGIEAPQGCGGERDSVGPATREGGHTRDSENQCSGLFQKPGEDRTRASTHAGGSGPEVSARRTQGAWEGHRTGGAAPLPPAQPWARAHQGPALRAFRPSLTSPLPGEGLPCIQARPPAHSQALTSGGALGSPVGLAGTVPGKLTHRHRLNSL